MATSRYYQVEMHGNAMVMQIVDTYLQGDALAECLKLELLQIVESNSPKLVVIDFQNVKLIGSLAVSSLLTVNQRLASMGVFLRLCSMNDQLRQLFRTLRLDGSVFRISTDVQEALSGPAGSPTYEEICGRPTPLDSTDFES